MEWFIVAKDEMMPVARSDHSGYSRTPSKPNYFSAPISVVQVLQDCRDLTLCLFRRSEVQIVAR